MHRCNHHPRQDFKCFVTPEDAIRFVCSQFLLLYQSDSFSFPPSPQTCHPPTSVSCSARITDMCHNWFIDPISMGVIL